MVSSNFARNDAARLFLVPELYENISTLPNSGKLRLDDELYNMNKSETQIYRADWILPISGEPIPNGEIIVSQGRILTVRPANPNVEPTRDFGNAILLPGLVNVHTHLDYTVMRGILEDVEFFPWIRELSARKVVLTAADWQASATWGAAEAIAGGITTIGDCTDSGAACAGAMAMGLGGVIYQEVFGIEPTQEVNAIVQDLQAKVERLQEQTAGTNLQIGISPHAPYTVRPELFHALQAYSAAENLRVCIHAAESRAEAELILAGKGAIAEMFARREIGWEPPGISTVAYLDGFGILGRKRCSCMAYRSPLPTGIWRRNGNSAGPTARNRTPNSVTASPRSTCSADRSGNREQGTGNREERESKIRLGLVPTAWQATTRWICSKRCVSAF